VPASFYPSTPANLSSFSPRSGRSSFRHASILSASRRKAPPIRLESRQPGWPLDRLLSGLTNSIRPTRVSLARVRSMVRREIACRCSRRLGEGKMPTV